MRKCVVLNRQFDYLMIVDGKAISIVDGVEYFLSHYRELGYDVRLDMDYANGDKGLSDWQRHERLQKAITGYEE